MGIKRRNMMWPYLEPEIAAKASDAGREISQSQIAIKKYLLAVKFCRFNFDTTHHKAGKVSLYRFPMQMGRFG